MPVNLRIHPAIGFARVGNSNEYYLQPETIASLPVPGQTVSGGLPIVMNTENTPITSGGLRDGDCKLKRQGARFRIYQYPASNELSYPSPGGEEVTIGCLVDGKRVKDIVWTVHLANKKANCWEIDEDANKGLALYENNATPPLRNPNFQNSNQDPSRPIRLQKLVIDAGPRCISALQSQGQASCFDNKTSASYWQATSNSIQILKNYPKSFPASNDPDNQLNYLGEMLTEAKGRLVVVAGFGKASGFDAEANLDLTAALDYDVDNDNWMDDTADGPVTAVLLFDDGSTQSLHNSAWVICTDPAYAPQTLNTVTLWDDIYNTWVTKFGLAPDLYNTQSSYNKNYIPDFNRDVHPILRAAEMQRWNTNLPDSAIKSHQRVDALTQEKPGFDIMAFMRKPAANSDDHLEIGSPLMPLSLGDSDKSFMALTATQYFLMTQWANGLCGNGATPTQAKPLGNGEALDRTVLMNCLGGRFSPGIDMTFIVYDTNMFNADWKNPDIGPFRVNRESLDYEKASLDQPFLGVGYIPLRNNPVQPGDLSKFMAIPWHTDYNSCATHTPSPNPNGDITEQNIYGGDVNVRLFWSWPAQRPVAVYTFDDLSQRNDNSLPQQRFSVRGPGTAAIKPMEFGPDGKLKNAPASNVGRFQERKNIILNWQDIGIIIQGAAIDNYPDNFDPNYYLEVHSNFKEDQSNLVQPWPNKVTDAVEPPK